MQIKDFKAGDIVYIVEKGKQGSVDIKERTVKRVGRKYVYIQEYTYFETKYEVSSNPFYLVSPDYDTKGRKVYKRKEDIEIERRYNSLRRWLFDEYGHTARRHTYSLEQLEGAVKILNPNGEYDDEIIGKT